MEQTKDTKNPSPGEVPDTFKQHYAGTFIAKRYDKYNHPITQTEQSENSERGPNPMEPKSLLEWLRRPDNHTYVTTGCAVLAAAIAAIYTLFAILQWCAMRESNEINRVALQTVQRPFVTFPAEIDAVRVTDASQKLKGWRFFLPVENSGNTSAQPMRMRFNFNGQGNEELTTYPDVGTSTSTPVVLGPKARLWSGPLDVSPEVIEGIQRKEKRLFFYGWACYRDAFPKAKIHITEFCWEVPYFQASPINGSSDYRIVTSVSSCGHHVCADDECKDRPLDPMCSE